MLPIPGKEDKMKHYLTGDTQREILDATLELGRRMVQSGAEVRRVEDTIHRVLRAYHAVSTEVFSISSMVLCTVRYADGTICTQSKRIIGYGINLRKLELYNALAREICSQPLSPQEFRSRLKEIARSRNKDWIDAVCYMISAGSMAPFFGGNLSDALAAALLGLVVFIFDRFLKTPKTNSIVYTLFACLISGLLAIGFVRAGLGTHLDKILISVVFLFIPTLAFCNSIKDMLYGDILTGIYRLVEAVLIATALTAGFFLAKLLMNSVSVPVPSIPINIIPWPEQLILAFLGSLGFSVYFRIQRKRILEAALGGIIGWSVYLLADRLSGSLFLSSAAAAVAIECYAEAAARLWKAPANIFLIPAVVPLLPGAGFYRCINGLMGENFSQCYDAAKNLFLTTAGIEIGFLLAFIVFFRSVQFFREGMRFYRSDK
jgi:uncharacterized membrane protein YjjP (DUF1212 family)